MKLNPYITNIYCNHQVPVLNPTCLLAVNQLATTCSIHMVCSAYISNVWSQTSASMVRGSTVVDTCSWSMLSCVYTSPETVGWRNNAVKEGGRRKEEKEGRKGDHANRVITRY